MDLEEDTELQLDVPEASKRSLDEFLDDLSTLYTFRRRETRSAAYLRDHVRTLISLSSDDDTLSSLQEEFGRYAMTAPGLFISTLSSLDGGFVRVDC